SVTLRATLFQTGRQNKVVHQTQNQIQPRRKIKMTDTIFKSVFTLDSETQTYRAAAHNLNAEQAVERSNSNQTAKIIDQAERHRNPNPLKCKTCRKTAEGLTSKHTEAASSEQGETVAAQESESD